VCAALFFHDENENENDMRLNTYPNSQPELSLTPYFAVSRLRLLQMQCFCLLFLRYLHTMLRAIRGLGSKHMSLAVEYRTTIKPVLGFGKK